MGVLIRFLGPADAAPYAALRLRMLRAHPDAFTSSFAEDSRKPLSWTEQRLSRRGDPPHFVLGAFDADGTLLGSAGVDGEAREKQRHKGTLFGMFTAPEARGRGVGAALLAACIDEAKRCSLERLVLTVTAGNAAERLYAAHGFERFGVEPRAIRVDGVYYDKVHMGRSL